MAKVELTAEIYSKEYYDQIFTEIEQISSELTPEEIGSEIQKKINFTTIQGQTLSKEFLEGIELFRVRVPNPEKQSNEDDVSWHSYPPDPNFITKKGRANVEGQQVFYTSFDANTAFHEMSKFITPGSSIVYLSKWKITHPGGAFMRNLFLDTPSDNEEDISSFMAKGLVEMFDQIMIRVPKAERENYIYGQRKYANLFTWPDEKYYHLTSSIAHCTFVSALKQRANIPILAYPSVPKNKRTINWAIRKDFKDDHVYFKEVYKVLVNKLTNEEVNVSILSKGIEVNGKIKWSNLKRTVSYDIMFVSPDLNLDNKRAVAKDDTFTTCCQKHTITKDRILKEINITEETVLEYVSQVPITYDFEKPNVFDLMLAIPIKFKLYLKSDITEAGRINYVMVRIRYTASFPIPD